MSELVKPQMLFFLSAQVMANLTRGNIQNILVLYAAFAFDKGPQTIGLMAAASSAMTLPVGFLTGYIMDRWGRKKTIVPGFSALFLSALYLAMTAATGASFQLFLVGYYALNFSQSITAGNMQVLGSDIAPERARGRFFGIWRSMAEMGSATSPVAFSVLATIGYAASFSFIGACGLCVALIVGFKVKETVGGASRAGEQPGAVPSIAATDPGASEESAPQRPAGGNV